MGQNLKGERNIFQRLGNELVKWRAGSSSLKLYASTGLFDPSVWLETDLWSRHSSAGRTGFPGWFGSEGLAAAMEPTCVY